MRKLFSALFLLLFISASAMAQRGKTEIFGKWKSIDDETGEAKSIVQIFEKDGKAYGKILEVLNPEKKNAVCEECDSDDPRKGKRVEGMEILSALEKEKDGWDDGEILDPNNGKVYSCKMWVENGKLQVRGYLGFSFIGRTQVWLPFE